MAIANLLIAIGADIRDLQAKSDQAVSVMGKTAKAVEAQGSSIDGLVGKYFTYQAAIGTATAAGRALVDFLHSSVESYAAAEAAQSRLTTALVAQGTFTPALADQYGKLSTKIQQTTVFSDDLATEMQALLVQIGDVAPSQMEAALQAATNLSAGLGIDLRAATILVGKAFEGETGTLKKYGIVIDEAKLKTEGVAAVLAGISDKFGGQAAAALDTYAGKVAKLANDWDNVKEAVGKAIAQDPIIAAGLAAVGDAASRADTDATNANLTFSEVWSNLATQGSQSSRAAVVYLGLVADAFINAASSARGLKDAIPKLAIPSPFPPGYRETIDATREAWTKQIAAEKAAAEAAKTHAAALDTLHSRLSGTGAIKAAEDYISVLSHLPSVQDLARVAQNEVNAVMQRALEVFIASGQGASALAVQVAHLRDVTADLSKVASPALDAFSASFDAARHAKTRTALTTALDQTNPVLFDQGTTLGPTKVMDDWAAAAEAANKKIVDSTASAGQSITNNFVGAFQQVSGAVDSMAAHVMSVLGAVAQTEAFSKAGFIVNEGFGSASRINQDALRGVGLTRPGNIGFGGAGTHTVPGGGVSVVLNANNAFYDTPEGRARLAQTAGAAVLTAYKQSGGRA